MKEKYKNSVALVHPECRKEVVKLADFTGSTTQIFDYIKKTDFETYIICTEKGVVDRLKRDYKTKNFVLVNDKVICHNMKQNTLHDILNSLKYENYEVNVEESVAKRALKSIDKMISIKGGKVSVN